MRNLIRSTPLVLLALFTLWLFSAAPAQAQNGTLQEGAELYVANCLVCHGDQGQGRIGATLAKNWPSIRPDLTVKNVIVNGVPGSPMPAWSEANGGPLTDAQIDALVAYILSWESGEAYEFVPPPTATTRPPITPAPDVEGDPNRGAVLYGENCEVCHGANGQGRVGATLAKDWPGLQADASVNQVITNGVAGSPMPAWSQAQGGPLSEQDIADLTAFIFALQPVGTDPQPSVPGTGISAATNSGLIGVLVTIGLFTLIVGIILWLQRKK
jgi:mono/diheme cytochrome c family protein